MLLNDVLQHIDDDGSVASVEAVWKPLLARFNNIDFYYLSIRYCYVGSNGVPSHDYTNYVPAEIIEKLKNDDITHLLVFTIEHPTMMVDDIYRFITNHGIAANKIILVSELPSIGEKIKRVSTLNNLPEIQYYFFSTNEFHFRQQLLGGHITLCSKFKIEKKHYDKSFLNLNRRWRLHRFLFVNLLACNGMLDRGLVSLVDVQGEDCDRSMSFDQVMNDPLIDIDTKKLFVQNKDTILNLPPLLVDEVDLSNNMDCVRLNLLESVMLPYRNTYFSVVSETFFFKELDHERFNTGSFITEKTFKTIAYKHPFILISRPGTLSLFKRLGYKTFSPYIDESYDNIEDDMERMNAVMNEVRRLDSLSEAELSDFIDGVMPILEYNFIHITRKRLPELVIDLSV